MFREGSSQRLGTVCENILQFFRSSITVLGWDQAAAWLNEHSCNRVVKLSEWNTYSVTTVSESDATLTCIYIFKICYIL